MAEELAAERRVLCHRDYHSRNLMLRQHNLCIIDFQDARMGPDTYDLVSLLRDSYVDIGSDSVDELPGVLPHAVGPAWRGATRFAARFDLMALQRNLKALGHVRLSDDRAAEPGVHPVHPTDAASARARTSSNTRGSRGCTNPLGARAGARVARSGHAHDLRPLDAPVPRRTARPARHFEAIAAHGFDRVELFATRSHFAYHDPAEVDRIGEWLSQLRHPGGQHARADLRVVPERRVGARLLECGRGRAAPPGGDRARPARR